MWQYPIDYDIIVIGGGHAGCEAALAPARMGARTLLLTMNLDTIGKMSCNPSIGGVAKGHIVREIDALGGDMGKVIDRTGIHFRMLNATKGPAVWSPRAQADKVAYQFEMKHRLELQENLDIKQGTIEELVVESDRIVGLITKEGIHYNAKAVIISAGTFMRGLMHIGDANHSGGRAGDRPSVGLSANLEALGIRLGRHKTGTPPRIHSRSIDYSLCEEQPSDEGVVFSYDNEEFTPLPRIMCHITYTTEETKKIIQDNIHRSPMYSGKIKGVGTRYCPSIEDKVMRFADKERHQIFLEPEGLNTEEVYVNGISSSLPYEVQYAFTRSIPALRNAEILRPAYAVEYDYVKSGQMNATMECKSIEGLYFAGQINGTSGYEEAAGQGLMAGINAALKIAAKPPLILTRSESYIGVMIDDLITKVPEEPYRMFTSRAEYRLLLRQDNADLRLRKYGYEAGTIDAVRYQRVKHKEETIRSEITRLNRTFKQQGDRGYSLYQLLARPENTYASLHAQFPEELPDHGEEINRQIELEVKYAGYITMQRTQIDKQAQVEHVQIPSELNFLAVKGLRNEAKLKLNELRPTTLGQASRISGVSPADISVLMIAVRQPMVK